MNENTDGAEPMWAIIEPMGHVKTGARVQKDTQLGTSMLRADVPQGDGSFVTQLINPASLYRVTFCEERLARGCALQCQAMPFNKWEVKQLLQPETVSVAADLRAGDYLAHDDDDDDDGEDEGD